MELYTTSEAKKIDGLAIKEKSVTSYSLMEKASIFSYKAIASRWPEIENMIVFCGKGNNAGDGYLLASIAQKYGLKVIIVQAESPHNMSAATNKALDLSKSLQIKIISIKQLEKFKITKNKTIIIDALLGIGLNRPIKGKVHSAIKKINSLGKNNPIVSLDMPSGICTDTGNILA